MPPPSPTEPTIFRAHGKLLLTGEYFVLDGALALALPTRTGQELRVSINPSQDERLHWRSLNYRGETWFEAVFAPPDFRCEYVSDEAVAGRLIQLFQSVKEQRPWFWENLRGAQVETRLAFPKQWGLGTSSTLVAALARWTGTDPFRLLDDSFGGSGYDLACAFADGPILYQLRTDRPHYIDFPYRPSFAGQLYFVYLDQKQNSRAGIARYREKVKDGPQMAVRITELTADFLRANSLAELENCIRAHEQLVSDALEFPRAKAIHFPDFWGEIKSLGAWGGDFVLATSTEPEAETRRYFHDKGFSVVFPYRELVF